MAENVGTMREIADLLRAFAKKNRELKKADHAEKLEGYAAAVDAMTERIIHLEGLTSAMPPKLGNIHDLPPALQRELSIRKSNELDDQIVTVINAYGGEATVDQILVGLYRKFGLIQKRRSVQARLEKIAGITEVTERKGHYSTAPQTATPHDSTAQASYPREAPQTTPAPEAAPEPAPPPGRMSLERVRNLLIEEGMMSPPSNVRRLRSDG